MKRVLWVSHVYPRRDDDMMGGFLHRLARELPVLGWDIHVLAPGADGVPPRETRDGVRITRFDYAREGRRTVAYTGEMHLAAVRRPLRFLGFLRSFDRGIRRLADEVAPEIVHAHWWVPTGILALRAADRIGVPTVLSIHGTDARLAREIAPLRPFARRTIRRAARVLPVSSSLAEQMRGLGARADKIRVLPMPADSRIFTAGRSAGAVAKSEDCGPFEFVIASRLTRQKRVDAVLDSVRELASEGHDVRLHVAGDGSDRERLERLARAGDLGPRVTFHGVLSGPGLADLYRRARAVVLVSVAEGYGLAVVEAALCGIPAVGVRSGGLADLIEDGVTGLLVEPGDSGGLRAALRRFVAEPDLTERLGAAARERAAERTEGPLAERLAGEYEALARRTTDGRATGTSS